MGQIRNTKGKGNPGPGRPQLPKNEKRKSRSLTISDRAWASLEKLLDTLELKSVSELVEKIGLSQLRVSPQSGGLGVLSDVPIYVRLKFLMQPPVAVFWSLFAFIQRSTQQLGLDSTEDFLCDVVKRAIAVVFYVGYTHPDIYINNPSALLRWVSYRILLAEAKSQLPQSTVEVIQEAESDVRKIQTNRRGLYVIQNAIRQLDTASHAPHYRVLKMKAIDGLTLGQIIRIFDAQAYYKTEEEVCRMLKKGLYQFRNLWTNFNSIEEDMQDVESRLCPESAFSYYDLAMLPTLHENDKQEDLEVLLMKTSYDPYLDFWMNEIDYHYEVILNKDVDAYKAKQESLLKRIDKELDEHLHKRKIQLDKRLAACTERQAVKRVLAKFCLREVGAELPLGVLLGPDLLT